MNLKIHKGLLKELQKIAQRRGENVETIIHRALKEYIVLEKTIVEALNHSQISA